jgi:flagellar biogenesis protein FliO
MNNATPAASSPPKQQPPLLLSHADQPKPLAPADKNKTEAETTPATFKGIDTLLTVLGSLGVVVGLFLVTMWCFRRGMPKSSRMLPVEVVEVLGRSPLSGRQQMHVIRFGSKLVLAAVSPNGVDSISEITDPSEVDRLAGHCQTTSPFSSTGAFRSLLDRLDDRSSPAADEEPRRPNRGLSPFLARRNQREEGEHV